jgi:hypothetical protein
MAVTAQQVYDRIKWNIGSDIRDWQGDVFLAGDPNTVVTGIMTTFQPNVNVLRQGVVSSKNLFIVRESPYWTRPGRQGSGQPTQAELDANATYKLKRDFITANKVVVLRLRQTWDARVPDGQLVGLAKALGWDKYYKPAVGQRPWATENAFFQPPPSTLKATAQYVKKSLGLNSIRVAGDPNQPITKVALYHGIGGIPEVRRLFDEPGVDLIIMGEPSWEFYSSSYALDAQAAGMKKAMIFTGHHASEEPGSDEMAAWLRSFVSEVPIEFRAGGEPTWMIG